MRSHKRKWQRNNWKYQLCEIALIFIFHLATDQFGRQIKLLWVWRRKAITSHLLDQVNVRYKWKQLQMKWKEDETKCLCTGTRLNSAQKAQNKSWNYIQKKRSAQKNTIVNEMILHLMYKWVWSLRCGFKNRRHHPFVGMISYQQQPPKYVSQS